MEIVTDVQLQKNKARANIFINGEFVCGLSTLVVVKNAIKVGKELSKQNLLILQKQSEEASAYEKALALLSRQRYTESALTKKLKEKQYSSEVIVSTIEKLKEYNYLSDSSFAKEFVMCNTTKSKKELQYKLMQKGIKKQDLDDAFEDIEFSEESEQAKCDAVASKYLRGKENIAGAEKKLLQHLVYKGFTFSQAKNSASKLLGVSVDEY